MVNYSLQVDFERKFAAAFWHTNLGVEEDNPDIYYSGQMEMLRLCEEYISAWNGGVKNGSK